MICLFFIKPLLMLSLHLLCITAYQNLSPIKLYKHFLSNIYRLRTHSNVFSVHYPNKTKQNEVSGYAVFWISCLPLLTVRNLVLVTLFWVTCVFRSFLPPLALWRCYRIWFRDMFVDSFWSIQHSFPYQINFLPVKLFLHYALFWPKK
jgi:hypothetical protein